MVGVAQTPSALRCHPELTLPGLCHLLPAVPPCGAGLACLPLQAGGDSGSGYGYCTVFGHPDSNLAGAAAIRVSNRTDQNGQPCRLPVMHKCALPGPMRSMHAGRTMRARSSASAA